MSKRVLISGGSGFVGSHVLEHFYHSTDWEFICLDRLNYAASLHRIDHLRDRIRFVFHDLRAPFSDSVLSRLGDVDYILHLAAETHVDNSLFDPLPFIESNINGTFNLLEATRRIQPERFMLLSTDEVFGPAPDGYDFKEDDVHRPSNPYSAAKSAAESLAYGWMISFNVPFFGVRGMNMYGERQHGEKYIPLCIKRISEGEEVLVHGNQEVIGSRKWLHARNMASGIQFLLDSPWHDVKGQWFHIAGDERDNLEIAHLISAMLDKPLRYRLLDFHSARPGHDRRYALDDSKIRSLGWVPPVPFMESLQRTVEWSVRPENRIWLEGTGQKAMVAGK